MRFAHVVILLLVLLSMLVVAGCTGSGGSSTGPGETPGGQSSARLPEKPGDLTDMKYLWNNVHYLKQSSSIVSTDPDTNGLETTMTWKLSDGNYKGQPALLLTLGTNSSADRANVNNSFGFNMSFDIYFNKAGDILTMLGGQAYIQFSDDPEIMQGELNVSELIEISKLRGRTDPVTGEDIVEKGPAPFSPTLNLSSPIKPLTNDTYEAQTGYDINKLMSGGSAWYQGFGNITLSPAGRETLRIGNKNKDCYKYTWTVKIGEGNADYTAWYSADFPAMPLKTVKNANNGEIVQTTIVVDWN